MVGGLVGGAAVFGGGGGDDRRAAPPPGAARVKPFGLEAQGTRIERAADGSVRVRYDEGAYTSGVWEVGADPYHPGVLLLRPSSEDPRELTRYFIDTGLRDVDLGDPGDLRKVFAGRQWLRRMRPIVASNDSMLEDPGRVGRGLDGGEDSRVLD